MLVATSETQGVDFAGKSSQLRSHYSRYRSKTFDPKANSFARAKCCHFDRATSIQPTAADGAFYAKSKYVLVDL